MCSQNKMLCINCSYSYKRIKMNPFSNGTIKVFSFNKSCLLFLFINESKTVHIVVRFYSDVSYVSSHLCLHKF